MLDFIGYSRIVAAVRMKRFDERAGSEANITTMIGSCVNDFWTAADFGGMRW